MIVDQLNWSIELRSNSVRSIGPLVWAGETWFLHLTPNNILMKIVWWCWFRCAFALEFFMNRQKDAEQAANGTRLSDSENAQSKAFACITLEPLLNGFVYLITIGWAEAEAFNRNALDNSHRAMFFRVFKPSRSQNGERIRVRGVQMRKMEKSKMINSSPAHARQEQNDRSVVERSSSACATKADLQSYTHTPPHQAFLWTWETDKRSEQAATMARTWQGPLVQPALSHIGWQEWEPTYGPPAVGARRSDEWMG